MFRSVFILFCLATLQCDAQTVEAFSDRIPSSTTTEFEDTVPMPRGGSSRGATALPVAAALPLHRVDLGAGAWIFESNGFSHTHNGRVTLQNQRVRIQV